MAAAARLSSPNVRQEWQRARLNGYKILYKIIHLFFLIRLQPTRPFVTRPKVHILLIWVGR
jgi:hypothetical protein